MSSDQDVSFLRLALEIADSGRGFVHPNPLVGAVVVRDNEIIGKGFHARFGGPHAEIEAIRAAGGEEGCRGVTLYVSLEPCAHHGKTPPCTDAIARAGFARVVYAMDDPNPEVHGRGAEVLMRAGIEVVRNALVDDARKLNRAYVRYRETGLPYVTWKIAQTLDGRMTLETGRRTTITGEQSWDFVRTLRGKVDAVAIGIDTANIDDPRLRAREGSPRDPYRVIFDTGLRLRLDSALVRDNADRRTMVVTSSTNPEKRRQFEEAGVNVIVVPPESTGKVDLRAALRSLVEHGIIDILLESGRKLGEAFLRRNLIQRALVLEAPLCGDTRGVIQNIQKLGDDVMVELEIPGAADN